MTIPPSIVSAEDYIAAAADRLPAATWAYMAGAGADGVTQRENHRAWSDIRLMSRVLADVAGGHTRLTLFGLDLAHPVIVAPMAMHRLAHPEGEAATLLGAAAAEALTVLSSQASQRIEDLGAAAHGPFWMQLYLQAMRSDTLDLIARAEAAGARALVVTVDAPVNGIRNIEARAAFRVPDDVSAVNVAGYGQRDVHLAEGQSPVFDGLMQLAPSWDDIGWLRGQTGLPILLKGVLSPLDAARARDMGVDGLVVSNHGGRVLDTVLPTALALPAVVAAAGGLPVLVDGGIRRGTDILKARALGASAVLVGLPVLSALAVGGAVGVNHVLRILRTELEVAMALTGCRTWAGIGPEVLA